MHQFHDMSWLFYKSNQIGWWLVKEIDPSFCELCGTRGRALITHQLLGTCPLSSQDTWSCPLDGAVFKSRHNLNQHACVYHKPQRQEIEIASVQRVLKRVKQSFGPASIVCPLLKRKDRRKQKLPLSCSTCFQPIQPDDNGRTDDHDCSTREIVRFINYGFLF